jgi:arabinofuranosyltransferase
MGLTRPDGLLFIIPSLALVFISASQFGGIERLKRTLGGLPILAVAAHLLWRRWFYGEWLPNTYYAKYDHAWPEAGIRYTLSFVLEYALWVWLALCAWVVWRNRHGFLALFARAQRKIAFGTGLFPSDLSKLPKWTPAALVTFPLMAHAAFYALVMGGDHFEYRVYSHFIVLAFVSFVWLVNKTTLQARAGIAWLTIFLFLSWPVPWTHWKLSQALTTRTATFTMKVSVAQHWPPVVRTYAACFDYLQFWLIDHFVCLRHQEHKVFCQWLFTRLPTRDEGSRLADNAFPVAVGYSVGVMGWVLPQINIIDSFGLSDYVIARNPPDRRRIRRMAHTKCPLQAYLLSYSPNVRFSQDGKVKIHPRSAPLTADDIRRCETLWRAQTRTPNPRHDLLRPLPPSEDQSVRPKPQESFGVE